MKLMLLICLLFFNSEVYAAIFKCIDKNGKIIFSDKKECERPDELKIKLKKSRSGKKIPNKITVNNADKLRSSPYAKKLSFSREWKYSVFSYYEGFYIIYPDHISIFIDQVKITKTGFGGVDYVDLTDLQFALFTDTKYGSDKRNWIYSELYNIKHRLAVSESVVYENIGFTILTTGYKLEELGKYKIMGIVNNKHGGKNYSSPILANDFVNIDKPYLSPY